jgi:hypothetical protein
MLNTMETLPEYDSGDTILDEEVALLDWGCAPFRHYNQLEYFQISAIPAVARALNCLLGIYPWNTPTLHGLYYHYRQIEPIRTPPIDFAYTSLTRISFDIFGSLDISFGTLSLCKELTECTIDLSMLDTETDDIVPMDPPIVLPVLHTLGLLSYTGFEGILQRLTLPALHNLMIKLAWPYEGIFGDDDPQLDHIWPRDELSHFTIRSGCAIQTLYLVNTIITSEDMEDMLRCVSSTLETLHVDCPINAQVYCVDDHILLLLCSSSEGEGLCPRLTTVLLERCILCSRNALATMVLSRELAVDVCAFRLFVVHSQNYGMLDNFIKDFAVIKQATTVDKPFFLYNHNGHRVFI